ncbi:hypothetical protein WR25_15723 [Diploscapter pachys]|uniref:guanylate cyclase n=1 Tax=Diploscapter pachys TaxID=2018661 RepID=A0A2A2J3V5_9BILA|nr:hypothetical protein WR25_15723 [Diploscapter pachys]
MIGWTHLCIQALITRKYGPEIWATIIRKAGYADEKEFDVQTYYDDTETMRIFRTAAGVLGLSVDDMWEMYGEHLINYACETGFEKMLFAMACNLQEFLDNLNSMHYFIDQIAFKSEMRGPTFQCEPLGDTGLRLHYYSHRQGFNLRLFPIVKGLVRRAARILFEMDVKINMVERSQERRKVGLVEHVVFCIEPDEEHKVGKRFAHKFKLDTRDEGVASVIEMLSYKNITSYLNTLFIFQMKHHNKRNDVAEGSSEAFKRPLCLKGQMMPINNGSSLIFLCSPHVTTVRDILDVKLFISDMPMHDATRDLVMLNQSRICQMELNKRLEETVRKMKGMAQELEKKKEQTDHLLFEFVPPIIAEALRQNKPVPAQEFTEATVLFTDIPDFYTINANCAPHEIVGVVTDLFHRFDNIIAMHKGYKVLSLMDSYLIVGGVPNANQYHCEDTLNLALGLVYEARQVIVPNVQQSIRLRIGIHCGPVVVGIVSQKKPRFCVLGNTVNVAKAVTSASMPGKILVSNAVRTMVTKHLKSIFVFMSHGYIDTGISKVLTHFLEKNEKLSVWDIIGKEKSAEDSIDGYKELHSTDGAIEWEAAKTAAIRAQSVIDALRPGPSRTSRAISRLHSVKKRLLQSNDSGVSVSGPEHESTVCTIS